MRKYILFALFLCLHWVAWGQAYEYRYWFDTDERTARTGTFDSGKLAMNVDVSHLDAAFHTLYLQVKDDKGIWSVPIVRHFMRDYSPASVMQYWLDDETEWTALPLQQGHFDLDMTETTDGFHCLRLQLCNQEEEYSVPYTRYFIKMPQIEGITFMNCLGFVDNELFKNESVSTENGFLDWTFDVGSLPIGLHTLHVQVITPSGAATSLAERFFYRAATAEDINGMKLMYSLDGNEEHTITGDATNGMFHFDVDVATLSDGFHFIYWQLMGEHGTSTTPRTACFVKTPQGGGGIKRYHYWLNENVADAKEVVLEQQANPLALVTMLPVDAMPIRSTNFHFEIVDHLPTMFARNDFHIAFFDMQGRMAETGSTYIDYNVSRTLTDLTPLQDTQTFTVPGENDVKWFTFDAEFGDSIALKSNIATSLQVFDAEGKEVYAVSDKASCTWGGCRLLTSGTCYVAVHDATGTGSKLTLLAQRTYADVEQVDCIVGENGYATLMLPFDAELPQSLWAYTCTTVNEATVELESIGRIPALTPLLLRGTPGIYSFTGVPRATEPAYTVGVLTGVSEKTTLTAGYLLRQQGTAAFVPVTEDEPTTLPAYQCYLNHEGEESLITINDIATGMASGLQPEQQPLRIYDLQGRQVDATTKPGIYIHGKKKVVITR